ncbi:MAG: hypothetical protein Q9210_002328, partial [Variospora velana]
MRAAISVRFSTSKLCLPRNGRLTGSPSSTARRSFSTTPAALATWGFIGLGRMGFPMAQNLRAKIPGSDTLVIFDQDQEAIRKFVEELGTAATGAKGTGVEIANCSRDVAEKS